MKIKGLILICILLFSVRNINAQTYKIHKADELYAHYAYPRAIKIYEQVAASDSANYHVAKRLAESYRLTGNFAESEKWYSKVVEKSEHEAWDLYYYAQVLKSNNKYKESDQWMHKFNQVQSEDSRGREHVLAKNYVDRLKANPNLYEIKLLETNSPYADFSPAYLEDKLVVVSAREEVKPKLTYSWNEQAFLDLYIGTINDQGDLTDMTRFSKRINTKYHEGPVSYLSKDSILFFTRNNYLTHKRKSKDNIIHLKIYTTVLNNGEWTEIQEFPYNNDEFSTGHPTVTSDGMRLYFASDRPGGFGGTDIYMCRKLVSGWSEPENLGNTVNTEGDEMFPYIHTTGTLFFASDGHTGLGGLDVFRAEPENDLFVSKVVNMGYPMNTRFDDFGLIVDMTGKTGYFSSNRENGVGDDDVYFVKFNTSALIIKGYVKNKNTLEPLAQATVELTGSGGAKIGTITTDETGFFTFTVENEKEYDLLAQKSSFNDDNKDIFTAPDKREELENIELLLEPHDIYTTIYDPKQIEEMLVSANELTLIGTVYDNETKKAITNSQITIKDEKTGDIRTLSSDAKGGYGLRIVSGNNYGLKAEKESYFAKSDILKTELAQTGEIRRDFYLDKIVLDKAIRIENIYYDFNKWNIRKDAAVELDKLVKILKDNPTMVIELGSHTDCRGTETYNRNLSYKRAKSAVEYIISQGIDKKRITAKGYGESMLTNICGDGMDCSEEEHQENRRTEFKVLSF